MPLPNFDASTGPASEKYFRAVELSKRLRAEYDDAVETYKKMLKENDHVLSANTLAAPLGMEPEPSEIDRMVSDVLEPARLEGFAVESRATIKQAQHLANKMAWLREAQAKLNAEMNYLHGRACKEFCEKIRAEHYAPLAAKVAKAVAALAAVCAEHDDFLGEMRKHGVTAVSHLFVVEAIPPNPIYRSLKSALEHGYLAKSEVPDEWLAR